MQTPALADPPSSAADVAAAPALQRRRLSLARTWQSLVRLPFVLGRLALELLPVLVFIGVATMLLGTGIGDLSTTRLVILAVVNAYALSRVLICVVRALFEPCMPAIVLADPDHSSGARETSSRSTMTSAGTSSDCNWARSTGFVR